ncbi:MAG: SO_0444 family Cu/Zn efflux transporter [Candidatus Cloacimonetes bacterium]|nr:SO_0444 family Cu/Zn efflux transporter [Candidatus Cloacimonadota bacterium]
MNILIGVLKEIWFLLSEMAPYLLFGFFIAGMLNVVIPKNKLYTHLSGRSFLATLKASIFGVPLPLCSCGVIPVAAYIRKEGAGKGATVSFLSSTPTTGVDSILATYSLLGPVFAIIRPVAAFFAGIFSGTVTNLLDKDRDPKMINEGFSCNICSDTKPHSHRLWEKIASAFRYGFFDLVEDVSKWIIIGILIGSLISFVIPNAFVERYLSNPLLAYPIMLLISIPMYICATGSIPIAASLILKGMTPGAGLVFLIAGPATNAATISFVGGKLGKKSLFSFLLSIIVTGLLFGLILDHIWFLSSNNISLFSGGMKMLPKWLKTVSALILIILILKAVLIKIISNKKISIKEENMKNIYKVPDMNCKHCVISIKNSVSKIDGVKNVDISLSDKLVHINGEYNENEVIEAIKNAGYSIEENK